MRKIIQSTLFATLIVCFSPLFINAQVTYTQTPITYSWSSLSTSVSSASCDDCSFDLNIGFTFSYFGNNYTTCWVNTNGLLGFGTSSTAYSNACLPNTAGPNNIIAAYWDDLNFDYSCSPTFWYYGTTGTSPNRVFTVSWIAFSQYTGTCGEYIYTQAKLYETSNIIEVHLQSNSLDPNNSGTIGIENNDGTIGYQAICNTSTTNGTAWRWTPTAASSPGTASVGTTCNSPRVSVIGAGNVQWQGSTDNMTFTDISGATSSTYILPSNSPNYYFRNRNGTNYSNIVQCIPINPPSGVTITLNTTMGATYSIGGDFTVNSGLTISMIDACPIQLTANNITMSGTIDGNSKGNVGGTGGAGGVYALNASDITCNGGYGGAGGGAGLGTGGGTAGNTGGNGACSGQICGNLFCVGNQDGYNGGGAGGSGGSGGTYGGTGGLGAWSAAGAGFSSPAVAGGAWVNGNAAPAIYGTPGGTDIALGSGGGGGGGGGGAMANGTQGGNGGKGGGMVSLTANNNMTVTGTIRCNGTNGGPGGNGGGRSFDNAWACSGITGYNGCPICPEESFDAPAGAGGGAGAGSGGGIKLSANGTANITGTLQTIGGAGGADGFPNPSYGTCFDFARGGAGGGGGRIKIFTNPCLINNINPVVSYNGGSGGIGFTANGVAGNIGTYTTNYLPGYTPLTGGSIASDQNICEGEIPDPFTNAATPTGGTGSYTYFWYSCTGGGCPIPISGNSNPGAGWTDRLTNSPAFSETIPLYQTTTYVRGVQSGLCFEWSNVIIVTVNPLPVLICSGDIETCIDAPSLTLSGATPSGGMYTGTGVNAGVFDATTAGAGSHLISYSYTDGNSCTNNCTFNITVYDLPVMTCPPDMDMCIDASAFVLSGATPVGGTYFGNGVNSGMFDPAAAGAGTHLITYTYTDGNSCTNSCTFNITVYNLPVMTCPSDTALCVSASSYLIEDGLPINGTYSGTGVSAGTFDPALAGAGMHQINYSYTDGNSCTNSCTFNITVYDLPVLTCPSDIEVCRDEPPFTLSGGLPAGGIYSGPGITGTLFTPAIAGSGVHTITYTYTDGNQCINTCTFTITVFDIPVLSCPSNYEVCIDALPYPLTGALPIGGTYTGPGVSGGEFNPNASGPGIHMITYTYTDTNTCTNSCSFFITVHPLPILICPVDFAVCIDVPQFTLSGGLPSGGSFSGTGVSGGMFDPAVAGSGLHVITYTYTDSNVCTDFCTYNITVNPLPVMGCPTTISSCVNSAPFILSGASPTGGTYSGSGVSGGVFDPAVAGVGTHSITYTFTDMYSCTNYCSFDIIVNDIPLMDCPSDMSICVNNPAFILSGATPVGGTYFGNGVTSGQFYPSVADVGTHTITYSYTDGNLCTNSCTFDITVNSAPVVSFSQQSWQICSGSQLPMSPQVSGGTMPYTHAWTGNGTPHLSGTQIQNPIFSSNLPGAYGLLYTATDNYGCASSDSVTIIVNQQYDATIISTQSDYCDNDSPVILTATDNGGTWSGTGILNQVTGLFGPADAGIGTHDIVYTIPGQCGDSDTISVTVHPSPMISILQEDETCIGANDGSAQVIITDGTPPYTVTWCNSTTNTTVTNLSPGDCDVWVVDSKGCFVTDTIVILEATEECHPLHVYIPNIFSPNGDGENDVLYVRGDGIVSFELTIFNRWGELMFSTENINEGWNGTYNGSLVETGVYIYFIKAWLKNDDYIERTGNITIVK